MKRVLPLFAVVAVVFAATGCTEDVFGPENSAPSAPQGVSAEQTASGWVLSWTPNTEADIAGYDVYRTPALGLSGTGYGLVQSTTPDATSSQIVVQAGSWIYNVRARDLEGNVSAPSTGVLIEAPEGSYGGEPVGEEGVKRATR